MNPPQVFLLAIFFLTSFTDITSGITCYTGLTKESTEGNCISCAASISGLVVNYTCELINKCQDMVSEGKGKQMENGRCVEASNDDGYIYDQCCCEEDRCNGNFQPTTFTCYAGRTKAETKENCSSCVTIINPKVHPFYCSEKKCYNLYAHTKRFAEGQCLEGRDEEHGDYTICCCESNLCNGHFSNIFTCYFGVFPSNHHATSDGCLSCSTYMEGTVPSLYRCNRATCGNSTTVDGNPLIDGDCVNGSSKKGKPYRHCCCQGDLCNNQGKPATPFSCYTGISKGKTTKERCGSCGFRYSGTDDTEYLCEKNACEYVITHNTQGKAFSKGGGCIDMGYGGYQEVECCCEGNLCNEQFEKPRIFSCHIDTVDPKRVDEECLSCTTAVYGRGVAYNCQQKPCENLKTQDGKKALVKDGCVDASTKKGSWYRDCCCEGNLCNAQFKPTNLFNCYAGIKDKTKEKNCGSCSYLARNYGVSLLTHQYVCNKNTCGNSETHDGKSLKKGECVKSLWDDGEHEYEDCCCEGNLCTGQFEKRKPKKTGFTCYVGLEKEETKENCVSCYTHVLSDGRFIDECKKLKCYTIHSNFASSSCFYGQKQNKFCCCEGDRCNNIFGRNSESDPSRLPPYRPIRRKNGGSGMFLNIGAILISALFGAGGTVLIGEISL